MKSLNKYRLPDKWFCPECFHWYPCSHFPCPNCKNSALLPAAIYKRQFKDWEAKRNPQVPVPARDWYRDWEEENEEIREEQGKNFSPNQGKP